MNHPDQSSKLPIWLFLVTDAALLGAAWYIAEHSHKPMAGNTAFAIVGCIVAGAIVALVPVVAHYERRKNEMLDQRQRELEALGRTISSSAEQISIAANGFNEITDLAHKNLKQAEQLPHRLQEKVAEFNAQLDNAREDDREELEKELAELRASETERLQVIAEKVHKAVVELTKLDTVAQKHLTARTELVERASETISKAQNVTSSAVNEAGVAAARQLADAQAKALAAIEQRLAEATAAAVSAIASAAAAAKETLTTIPAPQPSLAPSSNATSAALSEPSGTPDSAVSSATISPPKRPRKPRREEADDTAIVNSAAEIPASSAAVEPSLPPPELTIPPAGAEAATSTSSPIEQASHANGSNVTESEQPVASAETDVTSTSGVESSVDNASTELTPSAPPAATSPEANGAEPTERPARKRAKKNADEPPANLTLELSTEEFSSPSYDDGAGSGSDVSERVISSDGATRLIATAYIGIGNRLFVRGNGPGLSWEKGVPLQFVSIGKWRWETADAATPVTVKLFKNDEIECAALGEITLDPGHQQEVTARF